MSAALIKEGLVNDISLILSPFIVGDVSSTALVNPKVLESTKCIVLKLKHVEELDDGLVWLKYDVMKKK
ncbi:MAG: dihydrofolate reductase family protein [Methanomassiliicoccales archaeon]|nr:dihydrofolate reductase family protein [Methanomassiliicoccales archaeon]